MNRALLSATVIVLHVPVALVACSSSSSSGSGAGSVTTLDSTKQASTLSDAEKEQYCKDVSAYTARQISEADIKKISCFSAGMSATFTAGKPITDEAELRSKCKAAYQECMNKPLDKGDAGAQKEDCSSAKTDLANCAATVGELNACFADRIAASKAAYAKFDTACDNLSLDGGGMSGGGSMEQPASCKALEAKCPSIGKVEPDQTDG